MNPMPMTDTDGGVHLAQPLHHNGWYYLYWEEGNPGFEDTYDIYTYGRAVHNTLFNMEFQVPHSYRERATLTIVMHRQGVDTSLYFNEWQDDLFQEHLMTHFSSTSTVDLSASRFDAYDDDEHRLHGSHLAAQMYAARDWWWHASDAELLALVMEQSL